MKKIITLAWSTGNDLKIEAEVFGEWAVHQGPRTTHGRGPARLAWQITHVPSGLGANCMETTGINKANAIRVAKHLSRAIPSVPFTADELREAAKKEHDFAIRDERFAETGRRIHREIRVALGLESECAA